MTAVSEQDQDWQASKGRTIVVGAWRQGRHQFCGEFSVARPAVLGLAPRGRGHKVRWLHQKALGHLDIDVRAGPRWSRAEGAQAQDRPGLLIAHLDVQAPGDCGRSKGRAVCAPPSRRLSTIASSGTPLVQMSGKTPRLVEGVARGGVEERPGEGQFALVGQAQAAFEPCPCRRRRCRSPRRGRHLEGRRRRSRRPRRSRRSPAAPRACPR